MPPAGLCLPQIRFGFDPTKDPLTRFYQILDVRWKDTSLDAIRKCVSQYLLPPTQQHHQKRLTCTPSGRASKADDSRAAAAL